MQEITQEENQKQKLTENKRKWVSQLSEDNTRSPTEPLPLETTITSENYRKKAIKLSEHSLKGF